MNTQKSYLTHIRDVGVNKNNQMKSLYICDCGNEKIILRYMVNSGLTKSCGCLQKKVHTTKHGLKSHPLYGVWGAIKTRCYNKNSRSYPNYGGIGVTMCNEWLNDFKAFYNWSITNGWQKGLHIDKDIIPKKLGINAVLYSPQTCCFVTPKENNNNRHCHNIIMYEGQEYNHSEIAEKFGINYRFFVERLNRGWTLEEALKLPHQSNVKYTFNGETKGIPEFAAQYGYSTTGLRKKLKKYNGDICKALLSPKMRNQFILKTA